MSNLAALKPRPLIFAVAVVCIELVLAKPEDLKRLVGYDPNGKELYEKRIGMIYWIKSSIKNIIEPTPRMINEETDPIDIKNWLDNDMIYVAKYPFDK